MTRTRPSTLIALVLLGGALGWFLETVLVAMGRQRVVPPWSLGLALVVIAVLVVVLALPVYRVVRGTAVKRIDPFYATRVVVLAKASSLAGSLLTGAAGAIVVYLLVRSAVTPVGSIAMAVSATVGAVLLVVAGLIAEKMCTLPPPEDPEPHRLGALHE